jgi:hypothetical protein
VSCRLPPAIATRGANIPDGSSCGGIRARSTRQAGVEGRIARAGAWLPGEHIWPSGQVFARLRVCQS